MFRQDSQLGAGRSSEHASKATTSIEPTLAQAKGLLFVAYLLLASSHTVALDAVSMQLKWKHQFQFAGYNQALEQGTLAYSFAAHPFGSGDRDASHVSKQPGIASHIRAARRACALLSGSGG
jgi:hypothetical protein